MVMMVMMVTTIVMMMTVVLIVKKRMIITTNRSKLYGNCTFLQNFHTRKLGEITIFFAVFLFDNGFDFLE